MTKDTKHTARLTRSHGWGVACSCGWASTQRGLTKADALFLLDAHVNGKG
jgi:hypothetical protein